MKRRGGGILAAAAVALVLGGGARIANAQQCGAFTDVLISDSYCAASEWLKNRGITTGCPATVPSYCPSSPVTRAQMALFLNRLGKVLTPRLVSSQGQIGSTTAVTPGGSAILCQTGVSQPMNYAQQVRARGTLSANMSSTAVGLAPVLSLNGGPFTSMAANEMLINASGNELLHWSSNAVAVAPGNAISVALKATNHGTGVLSFGSSGRCAVEIEVINANPIAPTACGPAGCVVAAVDGVGNPALTVPAGALSAQVAITMLDRTGDPADPSVFHVYTFGPPGTKFSIPATVNLPAPPLTAGQAAVIEVSDDGVTWTAVPTSLNAGRVSGPISHFSMCRTRAVVVGSEGLIVVDAVGYQEFIARMIPPPGEAGSCNTGDFFGVCVKVKNPWGFPLSSNCPVPTPSPAPIGCIQLTVIPWQCSNANRTLLPFNPGNPSAYEGQHCNRSAGLLIPCPATTYNMDQLLPGGTLAAGAEFWVNLNFVVNPPTPANGVNPYTCIAQSGLFIGFDILFRDPFASDWQAGIRSAKDGPFVAIQNTRQYWVPAGVAGCNPTPPATRCQRTCNQTTCQVEWDWLADHDANYPTLRCARPGTPNTFINCAQYQSGDVANKNWFLDSAQ